MIDVNSNIMQLLGNLKAPIKHVATVTMLGEVEFMDPHLDDVDFEVEEIRTENSVRYTIKADSLYCFHAQTKCFPADVQTQAVRQWVRDVIQKDYGNARVTIV